MSLIGSAVFTTTFTGSSDSTPTFVSVPGLKSGDFIIGLVYNPSHFVSALHTGWFEVVVSNDDEIQQITSDPAGRDFTIVVYRNIS